MITSLLFDFSGVILFPADSNYHGELNKLYGELVDYPNFKFTEYFRLNQQLLEKLQSFKSKYQLNIFTSGSVQNHPEILPVIKTVFENIFSGKELNISKRDFESYSKICQLINKKPEEILFIDDMTDNLEAAHKAGLNVYQYTENEDLFFKLDNLQSV